MLWKMRLSDSPENVESCFTFAHSLSMLHGQPESVIQDLGQLITTHGLKPVGLDDLNTTINVFRSHNLENVRVQLDLALVGKLSYYSGLVFEIRTIAEGAQSVLGGGGRYNDLIQALGGSKDVPAVGFAYNLEQIVDSLRQDSINETDRKSTLILVIPTTTQSYDHALRVARKLRQSGNSVEVSLVNPKGSVQKVYAKQRNIDTIVTVGSNGETQQHSISN
jgi:histidyl-tRNA synthetase